jgi:hypothetical protein
MHPTDVRGIWGLREAWVRLSPQERLVSPVVLLRNVLCAESFSDSVEALRWLREDLGDIAGDTPQSIQFLLTVWRSFPRGAEPEGTLFAVRNPGFGSLDPFVGLAGSRNHDHGSLVPWVEIALPSALPDECCQFRDFRNGATTAIWRDLSADSRYRETDPMRWSAAVKTYEDPEMQDPPAILPVPGYVSPGSSLSVVTDPNYVMHLLRRSRRAFLGLLPAASDSGDRP